MSELPPLPDGGTMPPMGSRDGNAYCSFTKAVEHLGDRWSLLIVRELVMFGPQGFNALAGGLPGHISRSVLSEKLRKLEEIGLICRAGGGVSRNDPYQLTGAGEDLIPTVLSLRGWAERWLPDDPAMVARDPDILAGWLGDRVDADHLPSRQAIIALTMRGQPERRCWLVLEDGVEPFGCLEDPLLDESRYVYVEAPIPVLIPIAQGVRGWTDAIAAGSVQIFGDPELIRSMPGWFLEPDAVIPPTGATPPHLGMRPRVPAIGGHVPSG
jgi:DNA-binding HxlR family transcriptional regulator